MRKTTILSVAGVALLATAGEAEAFSPSLTAREATVAALTSVRRLSPRATRIEVACRVDEAANTARCDGTWFARSRSWTGRVAIKRTDTATKERIAYALTATGKTAGRRPLRAGRSGSIELAIPEGVTAAHPIALGRVALVGRWRIAVASVVPDATEQVLAAGQFNRAPDPDQQDFMVSITATNLSGGSATFENDIDLRLIGPSQVPYGIYTDSCGDIPDAIPTSPVLRRGGFTGNACWRIQRKDASARLMYANSGDTGQRIYFALTR